MFFLHVKYEYVNLIRTSIKIYRSVFVQLQYNNAHKPVSSLDGRRDQTVHRIHSHCSKIHNLQILCSDLLLHWNVTQGCSFATSVSVTLHSQSLNSQPHKRNQS